MAESKTTDMFRYWYDALISASRQGGDSFVEFCGQDPVRIAKLRILWTLHAGRYLHVQMHDGEVYEEWEKCQELSRRIIDKAVQDILSEDHRPEETAEIRRFFDEYAAHSYEIPNIREELHALFCDADEKTMAQIDEEFRRREQFVRWTLYEFEFARKDEVKMRGRKDTDEPPPGMDEFEYIDWVISHS
jgi:hypothetical protein